MGFLKATIRTWLWWGASRRIQRDLPRVIAITGSVGKTSAKDAVVAVLSQSGRTVVATQGNLGTDVGVPLSLLGFEEQPSRAQWLLALWRILFPSRTKRVGELPPYYVLEYSSDSPGDIAFLTGKLAPQVAVITAIVPVHMGAYKEFSNLVAEKSSLVSGRQGDGYVVLNADDPSKEAAKLATCPVHWFGRTARTGVVLEQFAAGLKHSQLRVRLAGEAGTGQAAEQATFSLAVLGEQQAFPVLAAISVGLAEGLSVAQVKKGLESYVVPPGRGRVIEGQKDMLLIDDSYNASPEAVKSGLQMLRYFAGKRRVVAILGRMNELGDQAEAAHIEVGEVAASSVDFLVAVGTYAPQMLAAAKKKGLQSHQMIGFTTPEQLLASLDQVVQRRDLVYIKASQNGMRFERIVKRLMLHPREAAHLLARQLGAWK